MMKIAQREAKAFQLETLTLPAYSLKLKTEDIIPTWDCSEILMCKGTTKGMAYLRLLLFVLLLQTPTNVNHTLIINDIFVFTQLCLK